MLYKIIPLRKDQLIKGPMDRVSMSTYCFKPIASDGGLQLLLLHHWLHGKTAALFLYTDLQGNGFVNWLDSISNLNMADVDGQLLHS